MCISLKNDRSNTDVARDERPTDSTAHRLKPEPLCVPKELHLLLLSLLLGIRGMFNMRAIVAAVVAFIAIVEQ